MQLSCVDYYRVAFFHPDIRCVAADSSFALNAVEKLCVFVPVGNAAFIVNANIGMKYEWQVGIGHKMMLVFDINHKKPQKSNIILLDGTILS